jgi:putative solute:sodium symporter small subunit
MHGWDILLHPSHVRGLEAIPPPVPQAFRRFSMNTRHAYWNANKRIMAVLLTVWAFVAYGCGMLGADALNAIYLGGFPLGFWFAQQGAIYVFVLLILAYFLIMERVDKQFDVHE